MVRAMTAGRAPVPAIGISRTRIASDGITRRT